MSDSSTGGQSSEQHAKIAAALSALKTATWAKASGFESPVISDGGASSDPKPAANGSGDWRCIECTHHWSMPSLECDCCKGPHCNECGQPELKCVCCGSCCHYPCDCDNSDAEGHKFRPLPPWEVERGLVLTLTETDVQFQGWQEAWPALKDYQRIDPCQAAADFYLLDALRHGVLNRQHDCDERPCLHADYWNIDERVHAVKQLAEIAYWKHVDELDEVFMQYVDMACGGELRHHPAVGHRAISGNRRSAWAGWRVMREVIGPQALLDMADLFYDWGKHGRTGYGGPLWAGAAEMLYQRITGKITKDQWVDRVFSLVHNGGVFLNKLDWGIHNRRHWQLGYLQDKVLPAHASDGFKLLLGIASPNTVSLWDKYWLAMNRARIAVGVRAEPNPRGFAKVRVMCRYCWCDPHDGHLLSCKMLRSFGHLMLASPKEFIDVSVKRGSLRVDEEDWYAYDWSTWEHSKERVEVTPDLRILCRNTTELAVRVSCGRGIYIAQETYHGTAKQFFDRQVQVAKILPKEMYGTAWSAKHKLWWKIEVRTSDEAILLGSLENKKPIEPDVFANMKLDLGLLLPLAATEMDWTEPVNSWKEVNL